MELELKSASLDGTKSFCDLDHLRDTVTDLDTMADLTVAGVRRVIVVGHEPFIYAKNSAGLQDFEYLSVDTL